MDDSKPSSSNPASHRPAWNKGKLTGPKPPLRPGQVWLIRAKLQFARRTRDLALFNLAIDSKLRVDGRRRGPGLRAVRGGGGTRPALIPSVEMFDSCCRAAIPTRVG